MYDTFWKIRLLAQQTPRPFNWPLKFVYRVLEFLGGCTIPLSTTFGGKPCLPHGVHGIFISAGANIGQNCVIFQHVTIGSNLIPTSKGFGYPTIGRDCYIGAGAKIIGNVTVGDNVRIGANAVVHKDVPDNTVVTASEQVVRAAENLDNRFYSYKRDGWKYFDDGVWKPVEDAALFSSKSAN
jgi:serine O-acetyltransferase